MSYSAQGPFRPKQAQSQTAANVALMMGDVTLQVARQILSQSGTLPPDSTVHDNGCGDSIVTRAIIETQDPARIAAIHATDVLANMCEATAEFAVTQPVLETWAGKVHTSTMASEDLKFGDDFFTHSYANFLISVARDPAKVLNEIFRTLRPGGIGFVTTWFQMPHERGSLATAHTITRPSSSVHMLALRSAWKDPAFLQNALEKVGFSSVDMSKADVSLSFENTREWCALSWGLTGAPVGGWTPADEEKWDDAVENIVRTLEASEYFESNGRGGGRVRMSANVATVRKSC
ncbi:hypothetical protein MMC10_000455 [Thelotrema lepadinum]|nr:hypothetical protein [Thelotrema lepadinum]